MKQIIECVSNFSEGRDRAVIDAITAEIEKGGEVRLLDVDPGEATNRTVVTFVGEPEAVLEAAVRGVRKAAELIDMRQHHGAHPRMGATDVLPLIPVSGITLDECAELARKLAERISTELNIPTYCYEAAAFTPERKNLAVCREGEYEGLAERMTKEGKAPDFGDREYDEGVARTGATAVGARDFLIAVNFNLNTTSTRRANAIAFDVREKGRPMREGGKVTGKPVKDAEGNTVMFPGPAYASPEPRSSVSCPNAPSSTPASTTSRCSSVRSASLTRKSSRSPSSRWGSTNSNPSAPRRRSSNTCLSRTTTAASSST